MSLNQEQNYEEITDITDQIEALLTDPYQAIIALTNIHPEKIQKDGDYLKFLRNVYQKGGQK